MSHIEDLSETFEISTPLYSSTLKENLNENEKANSWKEEIQKEVMNNQRHSDAHTDPNFISEIKNHNLKYNDRSDFVDNQEHKNENENKPLKLKVIISNLNVVNDLRKEQSPIVEKNSMGFVTGEKEAATNKMYQRRPIMGRSALLKKANIESNDSLIVYDIITEKYNGVMNHYLSRSAQRRRLKAESPDNYSDTVFSSLPGYSPLSISSINTPSSMTPDEKNGFYFPNLNEPSQKNCLRYAISTDRNSTIPEVKDEECLTHDDGYTKNDLRFITSTDNTYVETTDEERADSSVTNSSEISMTSFSDYDPKKFLENALGEITNLSVVQELSSDAHDDKKEKEPVFSASIGTSSVSNLLSKASTLYASAKENIKRCSVLSTVSNPEGAERNNRLSFHSDNTLLDHLMRQLSLQNEIMFQVSKALNYCKTTKKFESSVEHLEAEKILLVASCAKEALTKEIHNVEDESYEESVDSKCSGEVQLSNLIFHPKENYKTDAHRDFTEYFLIVLTCGSIVLASDVVTAEEKGTVSVKKSFNFSNLAIDFEICVCVYALRVGNKLQQNQELRSNCPTPKKILFYLKKGSRKYKVLNDVVYIKPSSFVLWGKCEIRSPDLSKAKQQQSNNVLTLKMHHTPITSSLSGTFSVKINTAVTLTNITNGFLTIGMDNEHGCTLWNRRWCVLEGYTLKYWNYPSEEGCSPLGSINLSKCLEQRISFADRSICARSRTLLLPVQYKQGEKKYLLSADSSSEVDKWQMDINCVIRSLKVWNCFNI